MRRYNDDEYERTNYAKGATVVMFILLFVSIVGSIIYHATGPGYEYQNAVHSHMENAYFADTPELMIEELNKAVDGMRALGLTEDKYGSYWTWGKTPDNSMAYQYKHIGSIINRAEDVVKWRDQNNGTTAQMTDIYEEKVKNLRTFIKDEGWSDDIAQATFEANNYPFFYVWWPVIIIIMGIMTVGLFFVEVIR